MRLFREAVDPSLPCPFDNKRLPFFTGFPIQQDRIYFLLRSSIIYFTFFQLSLATWHSWLVTESVEVTASANSALYSNNNKMAVAANYVIINNKDRCPSTTWGQDITYSIILFSTNYLPQPRQRHTVNPAGYRVIRPTGSFNAYKEYYRSSSICFRREVVTLWTLR